MYGNMKFERRGGHKSGRGGRAKYVDFDNPNLNEMNRRIQEKEAREQIDYSDLFG
jgi:hypothetical protein